MRLYGYVLVAVLGFPLTSEAWLAVCGNDADTKDPSAGLQAYRMNVTSDSLAPFPSCGTVSEANTEAHLELLRSPGFERIKYRVIPDGAEHLQVVLKSQSVLDELVADAAAATAAQQALEAELETNPACKATSLQDAEDKIAAQKAAIKTDIDAATSLTLARTAMTTMNNRYAAIHTNVVRCLFALLNRR